MKGHIELLQEKFNERRSRNKRFSLRSYSRFLGLDPGTLSAVLKRRRPLSPLRARQVVDRLKLSEEEKDAFYTSLFSRGKIPRSFIKEEDSRELSDSQYFSIIADWEYAAALCLMDLKRFSLSIASLQHHLSLSKVRAKTILETLVASGLIRIAENGLYQKDKLRFSTSEDVKSRALHNAHLNELLLAKEKLATVDVIDRDFSSITIATSSKHLPEMKQMIRDFRREFEKRFENAEGDTVYNLGLQLYPLSQKLEKGKR